MHALENVCFFHFFHFHIKCSEIAYRRKNRLNCTEIAESNFERKKKQFDAHMLPVTKIGNLLPILFSVDAINLVEIQFSYGLYCIPITFEMFSKFIKYF